MCRPALFFLSFEALARKANIGQAFPVSLRFAQTPGSIEKKWQKASKNAPKPTKFFLPFLHYLPRVNHAFDPCKNSISPMRFLILLKK
jgi:hypothetical protein